ncbi:GPR1/FUN34/yaaH family-domain-containing protein [Lipomyces kononenkoae]
MRTEDFPRACIHNTFMPHDDGIIVIIFCRRDSHLPAANELLLGLASAPSRRFANPAPLGLCAFGLTTFVLSLGNVQARGVTNSSVVIGLAYFYGGFIQLCAGMWEMVAENTFGATALSSFAGFWLAFGAIETDAFGIVSSYGDDLTGLNDMLAFFLIAWFIFTFGLVLCTLRSTVALFLLFFTLDMAFLLLGIGHFYPTDAGAPNVGVTKAGGVFGLLAAFLAWYNAFAGLATKENSLITVRAIPMPWSTAYSAGKSKNG